MPLRETRSPTDLTCVLDTHRFLRRIDRALISPERSRAPASRASPIAARRFPNRSPRNAQQLAARVPERQRQRQRPRAARERFARSRPPRRRARWKSASLRRSLLRVPYRARHARPACRWNYAFRVHRARGCASPREPPPEFHPPPPPLPLLLLLLPRGALRRAYLSAFSRRGRDSRARWTKKDHASAASNAPLRQYRSEISRTTWITGFSPTRGERQFCYLARARCPREGPALASLARPSRVRRDRIGLSRSRRSSRANSRGFSHARRRARHG